MNEHISGFYNLKLSPVLLHVLDELHFTEPTPIQKRAVPRALSGRDVIGIAQTGTGKTLAFALPMLQRIKNKGGKGLILVPTRELAYQAAEAIEPFLPETGLKCAVIIGGASGSEQFKKLKENPEMIIATPGRLYEHLCQGNLDLGDARIFVLDEADRMFDMGFLPQVRKIMKFLPAVRQTMMFSATMPEEIDALARGNMSNPIRIEVSPQGTAPELVNQELYIVERGKKTELLSKLLDTYWGSVLLFVRTRYNAKKIAKLIRSFPHSVAELHSNRTMNQRKEALAGFKSGKYRVLVATDIAARGIDVTGIELVINYDLPDETENYVHRIGRTGRAGHPGHSITFAAPDQEFEIRAIEKMVRKQLTVVDVPEYTAEKFVKGTEARPKGEKRLPRREMAGSENDPVKKPRNIFAARRKAAAAKKAAVSKNQDNSFEKENYFVSESSAVIRTANIPEYLPERFGFKGNIAENAENYDAESSVWADSEINVAMKKTPPKKDRNKKTAKKEEKSKKIKGRQKKDRRAGSIQSIPRHDKDYKPPKRSLIMDSAYFDDDTPEKRYFDSRWRSDVRNGRKFVRHGAAKSHNQSRIRPLGRRKMKRRSGRR